MKTLHILALSLIFLVPFVLSSSEDTISPSENKALKNITNTKKEEKKGTLQNKLDGWLNNDWTPTVEKDKTIKEKYQDKTRDFTLQEYVDKTEVYIKESNSGKEPSHHEKINSLPVIGKKSQ
ncbi:hypothetical protein KKG72_06365 [bacterium]|nr:hypothetical protein [bacterium]MBU1993335.1 hypothetical protein [bacterium]